MPGELGDEMTQQGVGYYERRYMPSGDQNEPGNAASNTWSDSLPQTNVLLSIVREVRDKMKKDHKGTKDKSYGRHK